MIIKRGRDAHDHIIQTDLDPITGEALSGKSQSTGCPQCGEKHLVYPRGLPAYCEECGWPDENFDEHECGD